MQEAHNLAKLRAAETPLLGNENPELYPSDFTGVTPKATAVATPNPLATPLGAAHATPAVTATPLTTSVASGGGVAPLHTPLRDELGLNTPSMATPANKKEEKAQQLLLRYLRTASREGLHNWPWASCWCAPKVHCLWLAQVVVLCHDEASHVSFSSVVG